MTRRTRGRDLACGDMSAAYEDLLEAGWCPRVIESSGAQREVEWYECPKGALPYSEAAPLMEEASRLNNECRGGAGSEVTKPGGPCDRRGMAFHAAERAGWCYGRDDEFGYQNNWHVCGPGSTGHITFLSAQPDMRLTFHPDPPVVTSNLLEQAMAIDLVFVGERTRSVVGDLQVSCRSNRVPVMAFDLAYSAIPAGVDEFDGRLDVSLAPVLGEGGSDVPLPTSFWAGRSWASSASRWRLRVPMPSPRCFSVSTSRGMRCFASGRAARRCRGASRFGFRMTSRSGMLS
jgi:hypothetical protein